MMGRLNHEQEQFFYSFRLDEAVPEDHPVREIAAVVDLSWVHSELAPYYPKLGRPSIDPVLMIRMLIVGYVFAIRSERALCRDVQVNLAYRWFCGLSIEDNVPDHSAFSRARDERFRDSASSAASSSVLWARVLRLVWLAERALRWMPVSLSPMLTSSDRSPENSGARSWMHR